MNLKFKKDSELLGELKTLVQRERDLLIDILHYLKEVDARKLHIEMGYCDLYEFAIKELGYSSGAAHRRVSAMQLMRTIPTAEASLQNGELSLSVAVQTEHFFKQQDKRRKKNREERLTLERKSEIVDSVLGLSTKRCERLLAELSPDLDVPKEKTKPLPKGKTLVQFVASPELMEKIEKLKGLMAHSNFEGRLDVLVERLADRALKKLEPKAKTPTSGLTGAMHKAAVKTVEAPPSAASLESCSDSVAGASLSKTPFSFSSLLLLLLSSSSSSSSAATSAAPAASSNNRSSRSRYISRAVAREVNVRDQDGCTYRDPKTGKLCGSKHGLQFDHYVKPFCLGGENSVENLTRRCGAHNRYLAEKMGLVRPRRKE